MRVPLFRSAVVVLGVLLAAAPAAGGGVGEVRVTGDELVAELSVAGFAAELTVEFEQALGLAPENLGLTVAAVSPTDLGLVGRLPALASIPAAFPVLVSIEPPATGGLSFAGVAAIGLYTHDLTYTAGSPLRLFASHGGGPFRDITAAMGAGSYRVRGSKGDFSEFLIVADTRPLDAVIRGKLDRLEAVLTGNAAAIEPQLYLDLADLLAGARASHGAGDPVGALEAVDDFAAAVAAAPSAAVPAIWRSAGDLVNVAGQLRAAAETLHFSLALKSNEL